MGKQNTLPKNSPNPRKLVGGKLNPCVEKFYICERLEKFVVSLVGSILKLIKLLVKGGTHSFLNVIFLFLEWDFPSCWHVNLHYLSFHSYIFHPCIHMQNTAFSRCTKINQVMIFLRSFAPQAQIMSGIILLLS